MGEAQGESGEDRGEAEGKQVRWCPLLSVCCAGRPAVPVRLCCGFEDESRVMSSTQSAGGWLHGESRAPLLLLLVPTGATVDQGAAPSAPPAALPVPPFISSVV